MPKQLSNILHLFVWNLPERLRTHWLGLMLWGAILFPPFAWQGFSSLPKVRWEEILLGLGLVINVLWPLINPTKNRPMEQKDKKPSFVIWSGEERKLYLAIFIFTATIILSDLFGWIFLGVRLSFRDSMEFITIAKYLLLLMIGASLPANRDTLRVLLAYFLGAFVLLNLISWAQAGNWFNVNQWLTPWLAPAHLGNLTKAAIPRVLGTFDNPNVTGIFVALVYILSAGVFLVNRSPLWLALALFSTKLQVLVISRGAMLSLGIGFIVLLAELKPWRTDKQKNINSKSTRDRLLRLVILIAATAAIFVFSSDLFYQRVDEGVHLSTSSSVNQHFELWQAAWEKIKISPILGWGSAKGSMTTLVDNEFLLILRRYGLIGLGAYALVYFRFWSLTSPLKVKPLNAVWHASLAAIAVFNLTVGTWYNLQLMSIIFMLLGLILAFDRANVERSLKS